MKNEVRALITALDDQNPKVRRAAAESLGRIGSGKAVVEALSAMLTKRYERERRSAADALMTVDDNSAVDAIVSALAHPAPAVRHALVSAITQYVRSSKPRRKTAGWFNVRSSGDGITIGPSVTTIVDALSATLNDTSARVRKAALGAMEAIRSALESTRRQRMKDFRAFDMDMDDDDGWGGPEEQAEEIAPLPLEEAAAEAIAIANSNRPEPRFADVTLYVKDNRARKPIRVPDTEALRAGEDYVLEVAIRAEPTGIAFAGKGERRGIHEPRQKKDVTIWVTADAEGFDVENPTQTILLPPKGDSTRNARFNITPKALPGGRVRLRFYYLFNIMEEVIVNAKVVGRFDDVEQPAASGGAHSFVQTRRERAYADFDAIEPRAMHIHVDREGAHYTFAFTFYNEKEQTVELTAPLLVPAADVEDRLLGIRKLLFGITTDGTFGDDAKGDEDEFLKSLRGLAQAGTDLWTVLFRREKDSALFKIGQWLEQHPLKADSIIQVSLGPAAGDFIFPWSFVYDRPLAKEDHIEPDPYGFWGLRYCIEQQLPNATRDTDDATRIDEALRLEFVLWEFRNRDLQIAMMEEFEKQSGGKLDVSLPPLLKAADVMDLLRECDADILYFYTHGYTRQRKADIAAGIDLEYFVQFYDSLKPDSPVRAQYKLLYDSIKRKQFEVGRSWIEPKFGKLYLDDLYKSVERFLSSPLVILNMCESAQITPSLSDSFIHFFLDRGAGAVLGTECPMTIEFAHPFAKMYLAEILAGTQAGPALLKTRRHYVDLKNPLGLAYTLFGAATFGFQPPLFEN